MQSNTYKPKVFLDFVIGHKPAGRLIFELSYAHTPKTSENFRRLCLGDLGFGVSGVPLHYKGSQIFKIAANQYIQGGDFVHNTGRGGECIYGSKYFPSESFEQRHSCAGQLSLICHGDKGVSSQFVITTNECAQLNDKAVVIGQLVQGIQLLRNIAQLPIDENERPKIPIKIFNCGEIGDGMEWFQNDEFQRQVDQYKLSADIIQKQARDASNFEQQEEQEEQEEQQEQESDKEEQPSYEKQSIEEKSQEESGEEQQNQNQAEEEKEIVSLKSKVNPEIYERFKKIQRKIKQSKVQNQKEIQLENLRLQDPRYEKKQTQEVYKQKQKQFYTNMEFLNLPQEKKYLYDSIKTQEQIQNKNEKKKKKSSFGWDQFNQDSLMKAYFKRLKNMPFDKKMYQKANEDPNFFLYNPPQEFIDQMSNDIEKQIEMRNSFSRRRHYYDEVDIDYINERNRLFNKKLKRTYENVASEFRANLERGTAI